MMKRNKNLDVAGTSHDPEIGCTKGIQAELAPAPHLYSLCVSAAQPDEQRHPVCALVQHSPMSSVIPFVR